MAQGMSKALLPTFKEPARLFCTLLVLGLAVYFVANTAMIYGKLDYTARDSGASPVSDFFVFYSSARFLLEGGELTALYDPETLKAFQVSLGAGPGGLHTFNYPPSYALLISPLGLMPYAAALILWQLCTLGVFAYALRLAGLSGIEILAACAAPASIINMAAGQNGFLTSALLIAGMATFARRPILAGGLFGLLTMKPHLGILVPIACLAERRWRVIAAAALSAAALILASLATTGIEPWVAYFEFLTWFRLEAEAQQGGPFLALTSTPYMAAQIAGLGKPAAYAVQTIITLYVCTAVYHAYRHNADSTLRFTLFLVGASLVSPYGNLYDLPFLGVAVILIARHALRDGFMPYENVCLLAAFVMPLLGKSLNEAGIPIVPAVHLALFVYVRARMKRAPADPSEA